MQTVLVTGVNGQDGSYLSELLLNNNYKVVGMVRRSSQNTLKNIRPILIGRNNFYLEYGDITDVSSLMRIMNKWKPTMIFNLAAQSFVACSFETPAYTAEVDAIGVVNLLEAARHIVPKAKIYQASTSEIYGNAITSERILSENSPKIPASPYGASKLFAFRMAQLYREMYGMFICNGILFNHESERRGEEFVTRKITKYIGDRIRANLNTEFDYGPLLLGNIRTCRDWGYAPEYVEAMYLMMNQSIADDYVISTGTSHTVLGFIIKCFELLNIDILLSSNDATIFVNHNYSRNDPETPYGRILARAFKEDEPIIIYNTDNNNRPSDIYNLIGDSTKAKNQLGWKPKVYFDELCFKMLRNDVPTEITISQDKSWHTVNHNNYDEVR